MPRKPVPSVPEAREGADLLRGLGPGPGHGPVPNLEVVQHVQGTLRQFLPRLRLVRHLCGPPAVGR
jgi:hypothetical protein